MFSIQISHLKFLLFPSIMILALTYLRIEHGVLLFHTLAELFSVFVGILMLVIVLNTQHFIKNDFLVYLGIGYFAIAILDSFHAFTIKGMPFFNISTATITIHFWVYTRVLEGILLLSSAIFLTKKLNIKYMLLMTSFITVITTWLAFNLDKPEFINSNGLTPLKIYSEYFIITLLVITIALYYAKRNLITKKVITYLYSSLILTIIAEACFTFYTDFTGTAFVIGHIFKFLSFWMVYQAIVQTTLKEPFTLLTKTSNSYDAIPHPTILIDSNGDISQLNQSAVKVINTALIDAIHQPVHTLFHPENLSKHNCSICNSIKKHEIIFNEEFYYPQFNKWYLITLTPIDFNDKTSSLVQTLTDISQRKHQENELIKHKENLEQSVKDRTVELENSINSLTKTQKQLIESEKMASLGGLVAGIAHEINTPIGIGVTASSHLASDTDKIKILFHDKTLTSKNLETYLDSAVISSGLILSNLTRADELIHSFKQVAVDQTSEEIREFKIKKYLEEILKSLQHKLKKSRISVSIDCLDTLIIKSSPSSISHIITNLVMNAIIHGFETSDSGHISIHISEEKHMLILKFQDSGCGIESKNLPKLFEPFFTTKRGQGGSGLGLNIVYNLVTQSLKGTITCESELRSGTTFIIHFPCEIINR